MSLKEKCSDACSKQDYEFSHDFSSQSMPLESTSSECGENLYQSVPVQDLYLQSVSKMSSNEELLTTPISDLKTSVCSTHSYKGVEYSMVSPVPEDLTCAVCHELLNDAHQTECGHLFCRVCLDKTRNNNPQNRLHRLSHGYSGRPVRRQSTFTCPVCRSRCGSEGFEDKHVDRRVKSLAIRCDNKPCLWEGTLGRLEDHKSGREGCRACQYEEVECCLGCEEEMMRKDLDHHCQFVCQLRPQNCEHCSRLGTAQTMRNHYQYCTEYPLQCPNECGESDILRLEMESHLEKCQEHNLACPYKDLGCLVTVKRRLLREHTQEAKDEHLQLSLDKVCQLSKVVMEISAKINPSLSLHSPWLYNTTQFPAMPWIVRVDDFKTRKGECGTEWLSEPLYTKMSGYKFQFSVYAGGHSEENNNHISVYTELHRGPHDSILSWPFEETVKVTLLNQLEDKYHYEETNNYADADSDYNEIAEGEQSATGWGWPEFIEHSQLDKKQDQNCQYLKNDCLFFQLELV